MKIGSTIKQKQEFVRDVATIATILYKHRQQERAEDLLNSALFPKVFSKKCLDHDQTDGQPRQHSDKPKRKRYKDHRS